MSFFIHTAEMKYEDTRRRVRERLIVLLLTIAIEKAYEELCCAGNRDKVIKEAVMESKENLRKARLALGL